jgi:hypothetical protein
LALIEQGQKKFSAINRRLHVANRDEFRILAKLNSFYIPVEGYPYTVPGGDRMVFPYDFDERVDILPVSDPDVISGSQRIVQGQAVLDLQGKHPNIIDEQEAVRLMLKAMRVPDSDKLIKVDSAASQQQQQLMELEIQIKKAELEKLQAERTEIATRGLYSAIQAAQLIVMQPGISPVADSIYSSAGGIDANGAPLANTSMLPAMPPAIPGQAAQPMPGQPPMGPDNGLPPEPQITPPSPQTGVRGGIETLAAD